MYKILDFKNFVGLTTLLAKFIKGFLDAEIEPYIERRNKIMLILTILYLFLQE
jgi:hypothetical protein